MRKKMRNALLALMSGGMFLYMITVPFAATVFAASQDPIVTTRSYDMDEYLNMLVSTGQWAKYEKFSKIASPDSWAKHIVWYNAWVNKSQADSGIGLYPVDTVVAKADVLGFDTNNDTFTLVSEGNAKALVKVQHNDESYYVALARTTDGYWYVSYVYQIK